MQLSDLYPNRTFPEPDPPPTIGPDADLFQAYREYCRATAALVEADEAELNGNDGAAAALERAMEANEVARVRFMTMSARTLAGTILKLECVLNSWHCVPEDEAGPNISDDLGLLYSAICDLKAMNAPPPRELGKVRAA